MERDIAYHIASHAIKAGFSDLPQPTLRISKKFILDTIGIMIAGSAAPGCGEVASYINEIGGKQESTLIMFGHKVPSFHAAFVNAMMAHALDYDDTHEDAIVHANSTILPSALAVAESVKRVSGKDFLLAYALGVDCACRIGLAMGLPQSWHHTPVSGYFGSALCSAKILGLDETKTVNALGIAYSQVAGTLQPLVDTALVKRMHPGFAARGGVFAAMLARQGITGSKRIFGGEYGFFKKYQGANPDILRKDLGKTFEVDNLSAKPYPCCMCTHGGIMAALDLVKEHNIRPEDIKEVEVSTSRYSHGLIGSPFEIRDNPQVDAQFSGSYTVAAAIIRRTFGITEIQEDSIRNPQILSLAKRVKCTADDNIKTSLVPVTVRFGLGDGSSVSKRVDVLKGNPANPTTEEEDIQKFNECVKFGVKRMSEKGRDRLVQLILNLESVGDIGEIVEYLA